MKALRHIKLWPMVLAFGLAVVAVVALGVAFTVHAPGNSHSPNRGVRDTKGVVTCLPWKGNGVHPALCAYGIKAQDGKYYGVTDEGERLNQYPMGATVTINGPISAPQPNESLDIAGTISARTIQMVSVENK
jgi:hypothetical protein